MPTVLDSLTSIRSILAAIRDEQALRSEAGPMEADALQDNQSSAPHPDTNHHQVIADQQDELQTARRQIESLQMQLQQTILGHAELKSAHETVRQRLSACQLECSEAKHRLNQVSTSRAEERRVLRDVTVRSKESLEEHCRLSADMISFRAFESQATQMINWLLELAFDATSRSAALEKQLLAFQSEQVIWAESRSLLSQVACALHTSRDHEDVLAQRVHSQANVLNDLQSAQDQALSHLRAELEAACIRAENAELALQESSTLITKLTLATHLTPLYFEGSHCPATLAVVPSTPSSIASDAAEWKARYDVEHASRLVAEEQLRSLQQSSLSILSRYIQDTASVVSNQAEVEAARERSDAVEKVNAQLQEHISSLTISHEGMLADAKDLQHYLTHMEGTILSGIPTVQSVTSAPAKQCAGCQHAVDASTAVACTKCAGMFHRSCARFPKNESRFVCDAHKNVRGHR